jgi:hypothetical protein
MKSFQNWLYSLLTAGIGGSATALGAISLMPGTFNFTHEGWVNIGKIALAGAWFPVLTYLKQSPLPSIQTTTQTTTLETTTTVAPAQPK